MLNHRMFLTEGAVYHQEYSGGERCYFLVTGRFKNGKGFVTDGRKKPFANAHAIRIGALLVPSQAE